MELNDKALNIFTDDIDYVVDRVTKSGDHALTSDVVTFLKDIERRHNRTPIDFKDILAFRCDFDRFPCDIAERLFHMSTCVELRKGVAIVFQGEMFYDDEYEELGDVLSNRIAVMT
jgi:hypothetical protein